MVDQSFGHGYLCHVPVLVKHIISHRLEKYLNLEDFLEKSLKLNLP